MATDCNVWPEIKWAVVQIQAVEGYFPFTHSFVHLGELKAVSKAMYGVGSRPGLIMLSICLLCFWTMLQNFPYYAPIMLHCAQLCSIEAVCQLLLDNKSSVLSCTCNSVLLDSLLSESENIIFLYTTYIHFTLILQLITQLAQQLISNNYFWQSA